MPISPSRFSTTTPHHLKECRFTIQLNCQDKQLETIRIPREAHSIRGRLEFYNEKNIQFTELWIQLEGLVRTHFLTKNGFYLSEDYLFHPDPGEDPDDLVNPLNNNVFQIIHCGHVTTSAIFFNQNLPSSKFYSYPFEINLNGPSSSLLPSFCLNDGGVEYRLVTYATATNDLICHRLVDKFVIILGGRLNLTQLDPIFGQYDTHCPTMTTLTETTLSKECNLRVSLWVNKKIFLLGDTLTCHLNVDNQGSLAVSKITLEFVQRNSYFTHGMSKIVTTSVGHREFEGGVGQIHCEASIRIPLNLMPTFLRRRKSVEILHFVQFTVDIVGKAPLRGEMMVIVGTTRSGGEKLTHTNSSPYWKTKYESTEENIHTEMSLGHNPSVTENGEGEEDHGSQKWNREKYEDFNEQKEILDNLEYLGTSYAQVLQFIL